MVGEQIRNLRCARLLSQVELAKKIVVSKQCICNWEKDNILPSVNKLIELASFFGCSTDYILEMETGPRYFLEVSRLSNSQIDAILQIYQEYLKLNDLTSKKK